MVREIVMVGLGGFAGSTLRYLVSSVMIGTGCSALPLGTCTVNVVGSLLTGIMLAGINGGAWYYLGVAVRCGGGCGNISRRKT